MAEAMRDLWRGWSAGPGSGALTAAFTVLIILWLVAAALTLRQAHRGWRPFVLPVLTVLLLPLAVAAAGLTRPSSFHWWALSGLALAPGVAWFFEFSSRRFVRRCERNHEMAPAWSFCPWCPGQTVGEVAAGGPAVALLPTGARYVDTHLGTVLQRPDAGPLPAATPAPVGADLADDMLVRLRPTAPGGADVVVRHPGAKLGRNPAADISIDDPTVSWEHAQIVTRDGAPAIVDLGSSNGTFLNGERVEKSLLLGGDMLQLGDVTFRVVRP